MLFIVDATTLKINVHIVYQLTIDEFGFGTWLATQIHPSSTNPNNINNKTVTIHQTNNFNNQGSPSQTASNVIDRLEATLNANL